MSSIRTENARHASPPPRKLDSAARRPRASGTSSGRSPAISSSVATVWSTVITSRAPSRMRYTRTSPAWATTVRFATEHTTATAAPTCACPARRPAVTTASLARSITRCQSTSAPSDDAVTAQLVEQRGHRGRRRDGPARPPTHAVGDDEHRALVLTPGVLVVRPLPTRLAGRAPSSTPTCHWQPTTAPTARATAPDRSAACRRRAPRCSRWRARRGRDGR